MKPLMGFTRISAAAALRTEADWLDMASSGRSLRQPTANRRFAEWPLAFDADPWTRKNGGYCTRWGDHGERPGKRIRDAARDRQDGEDPPQSQHLGLPDPRHPNPDDPAPQ